MLTPQFIRNSIFLQYAISLEKELFHCHLHIHECEIVSVNCHMVRVVKLNNT